MCVCVCVYVYFETEVIVSHSPGVRALFVSSVVVHFRHYFSYFSSINLVPR